MAEGDDEAANAPLMHHDDGNEIPSLRETSHLQEEDLTSPSAFIWTLTFSAGIDGLLFGYDTGVISSTRVSVEGDLGRPLTTIDKGLITSCTSLGALIVSPITAILADRFGRKAIILVADLVFIIGALLQGTTGSVVGMVIGRTVVGFAVGGASLVVPLYISELSPSAFRGRLVTLSVLLITLGQMISYFIGYALSMQSGGWRWMVGLGAAPALLQFGLMIILPESPRWLVKAGNLSEARKFLRDVYAAGNEAIVEEVLRAIKIEISDEDATSNDVSTAVIRNKAQAWMTRIRDRFAYLFHVGGNRRAMTIACLLQGLQQLCGFVRQLAFSLRGIPS